MPEPSRFQTIALGSLGAAIGGCLGYFAFFWIVRQGFYALVLPPGLLGYGAGLCARRRSTPLAVICGIAGLALGIYTDWRYDEPFIADSSLPSFLAHMHNLKPITILMIALGTVASYSLALGRNRPPDIGSSGA